MNFEIEHIWARTKACDVGMRYGLGFLNGDCRAPTDEEYEGLIDYAAEEISTPYTGNITVSRFLPKDVKTKRPKDYVNTKPIIRRVKPYSKDISEQLQKRHNLLMKCGTAGTAPLANLKQQHPEIPKLYTKFLLHHESRTNSFHVYRDKRPKNRILEPEIEGKRFLTYIEKKNKYDDKVQLHWEMPQVTTHQGSREFLKDCCCTMKHNASGTSVYATQLIHSRKSAFSRRNLPPRIIFPK